MEVTILGAHNIESKNTRPQCLLVDGIFALDTGCLTSSLTFEEQMQLRAVFLTHPHYDHTRDIPAIGMNFSLHNKALDIYAIEAVLDTVEKHLLNGILYPDYFKRPEKDPTLRRHVLEPGKEFNIEGYKILALSTAHSQPAAALQITSPQGKKVFYSGDTGPGLENIWTMVNPDLLIVETTALNKYDEFAKESGHLTASLLGEELKKFREIKGYLPKTITVHTNPLDEAGIRAELEAVAAGLGADIETAYEGMRVIL